MLVIEARREKFANPKHDPERPAEDWQRSRAQAEYTSASVTTRGKASWTYGRIEVRAKLPTGNGTWPAIWTLGDNIGEVGWPACGELDIMENVGFAPEMIHANVHTKKYNHVKKTGEGLEDRRREALGDFPRLRDRVGRGPDRLLRRRAEVLHLPERGERRRRLAVRRRTST